VIYLRSEVVTCDDDPEDVYNISNKFIVKNQMMLLFFLQKNDVTISVCQKKKRNIE